MSDEHGGDTRPFFAWKFLIPPLQYTPCADGGVYHGMMTVVVARDIDEARAAAREYAKQFDFPDAWLDAVVPQPIPLTGVRVLCWTQ